MNTTQTLPVGASKHPGSSTPDMHLVQRAASRARTLRKGRGGVIVIRDTLRPSETLTARLASDYHLINHPGASS